MKYRINALYYKNQKIRHASLKARRTPCFLYVLSQATANGEKINFDTLFELGELPIPKKPSPFRLLSIGFKKMLLFISHTLKKAGRLLFKILSFPFTRVRDTNRHLAFYSGVLVSAFTVALISALVVIIGLFGSYFAPYESISVPDLTGKELESIEASIDERYELLVSYKSSSDIPAGTVISQIPNADVSRKFYKSTDKCTITVTVSKGPEFYTVDDFLSKSSRDALLTLKNLGIAVKTVFEYSDTANYGTVISTFPKADERLYKGDTLTLKISLGKKILTCTVPDLYGLNEAAAKALLDARHLTLGTITYRHSSAQAGKIIAQGYSPYSTLNEGTPIDITVSLGDKTQQKEVPDLYGLSIEQASDALAEVGLVIGSIYSVSSGAPKGTVISQTPIADTPITSSITHVDIYISS